MKIDTFENADNISVYRFSEDDKRKRITTFPISNFLFGQVKT